MKKKLTLYDEINTYIDNKTGEVVSTARKTVKRQEQTPEFTMLFIQGLSLLTKSDLSKIQSQVLMELLKYSVNNTNMIMITKDIKIAITNDIGNTTYRTIDTAILTLTKKEIIIKKNTMYWLNPLIFGRGNFQNVKRLKQHLEIEYDFETLKAYEKQTIKTLYNDEQDIKQLKVVGYKETQNSNELEQEIILDDDISSNKELTQNSNELELLQEQNKAKELENKAKELENKAKELLIKEMQLKLEMKKEGII